MECPSSCRWKLPPSLLPIRFFNILYLFSFNVQTSDLQKLSKQENRTNREAKSYKYLTVNYSKHKLGLYLYIKSFILKVLSTFFCATCSSTNCAHWRRDRNMLKSVLIFAWTTESVIACFPILIKCRVNLLLGNCLCFNMPTHWKTAILVQLTPSNQFLNLIQKRFEYRFMRHCCFI